MLRFKFSFPGEATHDYLNLAGMILFKLQKLPQTGDGCRIEGWDFEVVDMDGIRIDKVLVFSALPKK